MDLETAVLEAIKLKLVDTFKKVSIKVAIEDREIVMRVSIPDEIMQNPDLVYDGKGNTGFGGATDLDKEASLAQKELMG